MKIARFLYENKEHWGLVNNERVKIIRGSIYDKYEVVEESIKLDEVKLLSPCIPSKAVCVGLNYLDHATEMNLTIPDEPIIFIKPSTTLNNPADNIKYPTISKDVHYEAELAIVIKKEAYNVSKENANDYILGYTCANDVTARDLQSRDGQWTRGKSFDTFLPLGPFIETNLNPNSADIKLYLNGELRQSSNTREFIFNIPSIIEFITEVMTLYPGDVVLTGTPAGVGSMEVNDKVVVEIDGIGRLENTIIR